jgi:hypothetical protein
MALNTYAALKTAIANWLNRTDFSDEIADDFIKLTEADFNAKLRIRQMEQIDTVTIDNETEQFRFGPSPDTTYTGYLSYYKDIAALSASNATNYILDKHPGIYLYGSLFHSSNFLGGTDQQQTQGWLQMYIAALERCENNDRQDSYGGAPVVQRADIQTDLSFYRNR